MTVKTKPIDFWVFAPPREKNLYFLPPPFWKIPVDVKGEIGARIFIADGNFGPLLQL